MLLITFFINLYYSLPFLGIPCYLFFLLFLAIPFDSLLILAVPN